MGSTTSPQSLFHFFASQQSLPKGIDALVCFADQESAHTLIPQKSLSVVACNAFIRQDDEPLDALRRKPESTLHTGLQALARGDVDAFISAGNTGALVAVASLLLPKIPSIRRPALLAFFPTLTGNVAVIDLGGRLSPSAESLVQYAKMGVAVQKIVMGIENPQVALLNVGEESQKGTTTLKEAHEHLQQWPHFLGNREAHEVFSGGIDVLVTDGYAGNILLKTAEGVSSFIFAHLQREWLKKEKYEFQPIEQAFQKFADPLFPAALLCGIDRLVLKCHGGSSPTTLWKSLEEAALLHQQEFTKKMRESFL